ncbi:SLOG family protein [Clostridium sp.]|uniref:SLOG family protein n=1 Tax=Clostridium sp. TaxID=1506 RepID=UPI003216CE69
MNIAFTGHRPNKLGGYDFDNEKNRLIRFKLLEVIEDILVTREDINFHFICGGAIGVDQFAFHVCNKLKERCNPNTIAITTEIAIPFLDQPSKWYGADKFRYEFHKKIADKVTYVDMLNNYIIEDYIAGGYYPAKMQQRNKYMVDNCDILIAVWDGSKGGTVNCVNYAKKLGKKNIYINPKDIEV